MEFLSQWGGCGVTEGGTLRVGTPGIVANDAVGDLLTAPVATPPAHRHVDAGCEPLVYDASSMS